MKPLIVTGTDTDVGKTVVSAMLMLALDAYYWKPIQSGLSGPTDTEIIASVTGIGAEHLLPEVYRLRQPLSPHRAAELDGVEIDCQAITLPRIPQGRWLIIEGAGGVLVPLTRGALQIELFAHFGAPVIVVARTALGTINHALLTIEALKSRLIPVHGIIFTGDPVPDTQRTIAEFSGERILGCVPRLHRIDADALLDVFASEFRREDFPA
jgi:dethiobiotin synthase